jgi:ubiquinone/menaquinone biosynthesis C-methylase UbiE
MKTWTKSPNNKSMARQNMSDDFYDKLKPRLHERIGRELRLAFRVLDFGCGGCDLAMFLSRRYRQDVTGVDISDAAFPPHASLTASRKLGLRCIRADGARLDFLENGGMDAAVSVWALHEMKAPGKVLREVYRKIRPGGGILVVDFPRRSLADRLWHENYYSVSEIRNMLSRAGFQQVQARRIERNQLIWARGWRNGRNRC